MPSPIDTEACEVVITAPDAEWLAAFTRMLVERRLAAAGQTVITVRSIYRWQGQIYDRHEARVALHTQPSLVPRIVALTNQQHPYEVPCVTATPIVDGNPEYIRWITAETTEVTDGPAS
jgi:periplasmic divalent cation tolerance protein